MANALPPVPYKSPISGPQGMLTAAWVGWFREAFQKLGGSVALSIPELSQSIENAASDLAGLQNEISEAEARIAALGTGLNQGPVL